MSNPSSTASASASGEKARAAQAKTTAAAEARIKRRWKQRKKKCVKCRVLVRVVINRLFTAMAERTFDCFSFSPPGRLFDRLLPFRGIPAAFYRRRRRRTRLWRRRSLGVPKKRRKRHGRRRRRRHTPATKPDWRHALCMTVRNARAEVAWDSPVCSRSTRTQKLLLCFISFICIVLWRFPLLKLARAHYYYSPIYAERSSCTSANPFALPSPPPPPR